MRQTEKLNPHLKLTTREEEKIQSTKTGTNASNSRLEDGSGIWNEDVLKDSLLNSDSFDMNLLGNKSISVKLPNKQEEEKKAL